MDDDDFDDEPPKRKKKGKPLLNKKRATLITAIIIIFVIGAAFQHYFIEPILEETNAQKYARCLTQKDVLDQRFIECSNTQKACEYQLSQCTGT